jgi:uncharacterized membrane protein YbhN (UPF0104 family)
MSRRTTLSLVFLAASLAVLAFLLSRMNLRLVLRSLAEVRWIWVLALALLNIFHTWIEALRWNRIISSLNPDSTASQAFTALLVGVLGNILLPLRLGDGARALFLARKQKMRFSGTLSTVVLDRIVDIAFFLALIGVTALFFPFSSSQRKTFFVSAVGLAAAVAVIVLMARGSWPEKLRSFGRPGRAMADQAEHLRRGFSALREAGIMLPTGALAALSWILRAALVWMMFRAFRLDLPPVDAAVTLILLNLGTAAVNTPANIGSFELAGVAALAFFGVETEKALSLVVLLHATEVLPIVVLGLAVLWRTGFRIAAPAPETGPR